MSGKELKKRFKAGDLIEVVCDDWHRHPEECYHRGGTGTIIGITQLSNNNWYWEAMMDGHSVPQGSGYFKDHHIDWAKPRPVMETEFELEEIHAGQEIAHDASKRR